MFFRGDAGCFTFGFIGMKKGRIGQRMLIEAAFFCLKDVDRLSRQPAKRNISQFVSV
jgi:hypothetical protein